MKILVEFPSAARAAAYSSYRSIKMARSRWSLAKHARILHGKTLPPILTGIDAQNQPWLFWLGILQKG